MKKLCISYNRFSSPKQAGGDSLRRQTEAAREYAEKRGLEFDETLTDQGLSGYKGHHVSKGALGRFLDRVEKGQIPKGSVLVVENIDRLSRLKPTDAIDLFNSIIRSGINLHVTSRHFTFTEDNLNDNIGNFYQVIGEISRAYEESKRKSSLAKAAWKNKRNMAEKGVVITNWVPAWCEVVDEVIVPIPERAEIVKLIFQLTEQGYGGLAIAKQLNAKGVKYWGKGGTWYQSYIVTVITNKAVYGEFTPGKIIGGKRVLQEDQSIEDYYPAIIDKERFYRAQEIIKARKKGNARPGVTCSNLFTGIAKCPVCGGSMVSRVSVKKNENYQGLVCKNANLRNGKCSLPTTAFNLRELEKAFLAYCKELNVYEIVSEDGQLVTEIEGKRAYKKALGGQIEDKQAFIDNLFGQIEKWPNRTDMLMAKIDATQEKVTALEKELEEVETELSRLESQGVDTERHLADIKELNELLETGDTVDIRQRLRQRIADLVKQLDVYPLGLNGEGKDHRAFCVTFHNGSFKEIGFDPEIGYYILTDTTGSDPVADEIDEALSKAKGPMALKPIRLPLYHPNPYDLALRHLARRAQKMEAKGMTPRQIVDTFGEEGVVNSKGNPFTISSYHRVIRKRFA